MKRSTMSFKAAVAVSLTLCTVVSVAGCSSQKMSANDGEALARLVDTARETGSIIDAAHIPNSVVDGWYVYSTPARPYPNAAGFLLQRGEGTSAFCVRQDKAAGGAIEVLPTICPDPMGTANMSDAEAALGTLVARAAFLGGRDEATASPLVASVDEAAAQLREEGHPITVSKNTLGTTEVGVDGKFACRIATVQDETTYVGTCPK